MSTVITSVHEIETVDPLPKGTETMLSCPSPLGGAAPSLPTDLLLGHKPAAKQSTVVSMCGVCPEGCGAEVHLVDGRIQRIAALKGHPHSVLCTRGMKTPDIVYSPDRLLYPQRRVGARGEGRFERITWDEAYALIVNNLQHIAAEYGPEAVGTYTGRGNFEYSLNEMFAPAGTANPQPMPCFFPLARPIPPALAPSVMSPTV
ncbi:MAG: molybdopterin-dependent oxidoreductase [Caldilineaceae bacterium]